MQFCEGCPAKGRATCKLIGIQKLEGSSMGVVRDAIGYPSEPVFMEQGDKPGEFLDNVRRCEGPVEEKPKFRLLWWRKKKACGALGERVIKDKALLLVARSSILGERIRIQRRG